VGAGKHPTRCSVLTAHTRDALTWNYEPTRCVVAAKCLRGGEVRPFAHSWGAVHGTVVAMAGIAAHQFALECLAQAHNHFLNSARVVAQLVALKDGLPHGLRHATKRTVVDEH